MAPISPTLTATRRVAVGADVCPALPLDVTAADLDLVIDRGLALVGGAEADVDHRAHDILFP
jgi:hypothetical protein